MHTVADQYVVDEFGQGAATVLLLGGAAQWPGLLARHGIVADVVADADGLISRLAADWSIGTVVVDLDLATPALLERLARGSGMPRLIALCAAGAAELGGLALAVPGIDFQPSTIDDDALATAVAAALHPAAGVGVAELSDRGAARIGALSAEVERIATALASLAATERAPASAVLTVTAAQVRALIKRRRLRERYFPAELFSDPAWDMLLDLIAAQLEAKSVSVSSLCIAAAVPTTTALRWIRSLCDAGLFLRHTDPSDARRAFIALSPATAASMLDYLAAAR